MCKKSQQPVPEDQDEEQDAPEEIEPVVEHPLNEQPHDGQPHDGQPHDGQPEDEQAPEERHGSVRSANFVGQVIGPDDEEEDNQPQRHRGRTHGNLLAAHRNAQPPQPGQPPQPPPPPQQAPPPPPQQPNARRLAPVNPAARVLLPEQAVEEIFHLNQPNNAQQGQQGAQAAPQAPQQQGIHESSIYNGPKKGKASKVGEGLDIFNRVLGHATTAAGIVSGGEKTFVSEEKSKETNWPDILNTVVGGVKTASSFYSMTRQAHHARKLQGRNKIEHRKNTADAIGSSIKTIGNLLSTGSGISSLSGNKGLAGDLSLWGSVAGSVGSVFDMASSGAAAESYRKIAKKYKNMNRTNTPNRSVADAA